MRTKLTYVINVDWYFRLHWLERAEFFLQKGYEIHIVSEFSDLKIKEELEGKGFFCHRLPLKRRSINVAHEISTIYKLFKILRSINPLIIHSITIKPNIYVGILNRLFLNLPVVFSVTGLGAVFSSTRIKFKLLKQVVRNFYSYISRNNSRFLFENTEDKALFTQLGILRYNNGIVIKGAGIDLERFSPSTPPFNRQVLFAARLLEDKGLRCLVQAKEILSQKGVDFTLNVAGILDKDVAGAMPIEDITDWANKGVINWLGNVSNMPKLISQNDVVCLPTTYGEGVPRILIEAASCQRAIIATDVVGCREIIDDGYNGYMAAPNDPQSLADIIQKIILDRQSIDRFGINGRAKVQEEFSQEMVFDKTFCVYQELTSTRFNDEIRSSRAS